MILSRCYYVSYHVADFSADDKSTCREDAYQNYNNALLVAKELVKCLDVINDVYVIDGLTGEILNTVSKAAPNENDTEEDSIPTFTDTFEDKNGGVWRLLENGKWDYDCTGLCCSDCIYCNSDNGRCDVVEPLCEEDRNYQIELASKRIHTKTNENDVINNEPFEDGFGGIWCKNEDDELWYYDCGGISCYGCPYNDDDYRFCNTNDLHLDEVKKLVAKTKERIGK